MRKNVREGLRTWITVDRKAIQHNFRAFRALIPKRTRLMAVVKSNAYGHGLLDFSREMARLGADFLGVDSVVEALALRREGIALPILVLGYTLPNMLQEAAAHDISLTVSSFESLSAIKRARPQKPLRLHIKVDTGMHRQGFLAQDLPQVLLRIKDKGLRIETDGLYTHFAAAKNPAFPRDTASQLAEFEKWIAAFRRAGHQPMVHAAATAGALLFPESHYDMVRLGIGLYGLWPSAEVEAARSSHVRLIPALTWRTIVSEVKRVRKGERVGYDLTEALSRDTTLGICPVGYWHGYPRALSSIGEALVRRKRAKVLGRVSMDMLAIDLTDIPGALPGEEAVLLGRAGREEISAERLGSLSQTVNYEIIARLNPLIKRIYR